MKIIILTAVMLFITGSLLSQTPQAFKYQAVARSSNGELIYNQQVSFRTSILQGDSNGTVVYSETHTALTNEFGLVILEIGNGTPVSGTFNQIEWGVGPYFFKIEMDQAGGNNYQYFGTSQLLSVPYSLYSDKSGNSYWDKLGTSIFYSNGNVGIGTQNPIAKLDIRSNTPDDGAALRIGNSDLSHWIDFFGGRTNDPNPYIWWKAGDPLRFATDEGGWSEKMRITGDGKVGIGTSTPSNNLDINGAVGLVSLSPYNVVDGSNYIKMFGGTGKDNWVMFRRTGASPSGNSGVVFSYFDTHRYFFYNAGTGLKIDYSDDNSLIPELVNATNLFFIKTNGNIGIGTTNPTQKLDVNGTTRTKILEITGGSDLAEPFPVSDLLIEGSVVVIDENNPGHLILSNEPYDKKVAGIVSGACGIQPGLTLKQEGLMDGTQNIALSGRVYVLATTENGVIKPGDRLTTSSTKGYAMKAIDATLCDGAVIGKAMSALENEKGMVLVLVNLQ